MCAVYADAQTLLETGVALDTEDKFITVFRTSPDRRRVSVGIGLDTGARLAVFDVDQGPPWREQWSKHKGSAVIDAEEKQAVEQVAEKAAPTAAAEAEGSKGKKTKGKKAKVRAA